MSEPEITIPWSDIKIHGGIDEKGEAICEITVTGPGVEMVNTVPPDDARKLGLAWLRSADAAELGYAVHKVLPSDQADAIQEAIMGHFHRDVIID